MDIGYIVVIFFLCPFLVVCAVALEQKRKRQKLEEARRERDRLKAEQEWERKKRQEELRASQKAAKDRERKIREEEAKRQIAEQRRIAQIEKRRKEKEAEAARIAKEAEMDEHRRFVAQQRRLMTDSLRYDVLSRDGFRCVICGATAEDGYKLHVDHIKPVSKGGLTEMSNLRTLCERCNMGKGAKIEPLPQTSESA